MFFRRPKYHRFEYLPRYYDPDKDHAEDFRRKMQRERRSSSRRKRPLVWWLAVMVLVVYAYLYLAGVIR